MIAGIIVGVALVAAPIQQSFPVEQEVAQSWSCQPRKTCGKIRSCEEAEWYLENCSWGGKLDRDNDGRPCESLC